MVQNILLEIYSKLEVQIFFLVFILNHFYLNGQGSSLLIGITSESPPIQPTVGRSFHIIRESYKRCADVQDFLRKYYLSVSILRHYYTYRYIVQYRQLIINQMLFCYNVLEFNFDQCANFLFTFYRIVSSCFIFIILVPGILASGSSTSWVKNALKVP